MTYNLTILIDIDVFSEIVNVIGPAAYCKEISRNSTSSSFSIRALRLLEFLSCRYPQDEFFLSPADSNLQMNLFFVLLTLKNQLVTRFENEIGICSVVLNLQSARLNSVVNSSSSCGSTATPYLSKQEKTGCHQQNTQSRSESFVQYRAHHQPPK